MRVGLDPYATVWGYYFRNNPSCQWLFWVLGNRLRIGYATMSKIGFFMALHPDTLKRKKSHKSLICRTCLLFGCSWLSLPAEREGFEPPEALTSTVFKTAAIDHSATSPRAAFLLKSGANVKPFLLSCKFLYFFFEKLNLIDLSKQKTYLCQSKIIS